MCGSTLAARPQQCFTDSNISPQAINVSGMTSRINLPWLYKTDWSAVLVLHNHLIYFSVPFVGCRKNLPTQRLLKFLEQIAWLFESQSTVRQPPAGLWLLLKTFTKLFWLNMTQLSGKQSV